MHKKQKTENVFEYSTVKNDIKKLLINRAINNIYKLINNINNNIPYINQKYRLQFYSKYNSEKI